MSKKLIAVAAAAALAITGLVAAPATASTLDVTAASHSTTKATPETVMVPETNQIEKGQTSTEFEVTASADDQTVNFVADGGVRLVVAKNFADAEKAEAGSFPAISEGVTKYSKTLETATTDAVSVWAFTTSTATGTLTISIDGTSQVYYIAGTPGAAYNVSASFPSSLPTTGDGVVVKATVTDVFGNALTAANSDVTTYSGFSNAVSDTALRLSMVGAEVVAGGATTSTTWVYKTKTKVWESEKIYSAISGPTALRLDLISDNGDAPDLTDYGFAAAKATAFSSVSAQSLEDQIKTLTALVATLKANRVTKKRYNTLARKWNAANPSAKVKLKK
jgi:hypothetical protein